MNNTQAGASQEGQLRPKGTVKYDFQYFILEIFPEQKPFESVQGFGIEFFDFVKAEH